VVAVHTAVAVARPMVDRAAAVADPTAVAAAHAVVARQVVAAMVDHRVVAVAVADDQNPSVERCY